MNFRLYIATFVSLSALLLGAVFTVNVLVDPYSLYHLSPLDLDRSPAYRLNRQLYRLSLYETLPAPKQGGPSHVFVGDSTIAQLQITPESFGVDHSDWYNAAIDGSNMAEINSQVRRIIEQDQIHLIVIGTPLRRFLTDRRNLVPPAVRAMEERWRYALGYNALRASMEILIRAALSWPSEPFSPVGDKDAIVENSLQITRSTMNTTTWPEETVSKLFALEDLAAEKGIRFVYFIPPQHSQLNAVFATEFPAWQNNFEQAFANKCVLDMNAALQGPQTDAILKDAVHVENPMRVTFSGSVLAALQQLDCADLGG